MIAYLNELLGLDPLGISALFTNTVFVTDAIADHEHAVVGMDSSIGTLGVLNGIRSIAKLPLIEYIINDGVISEFREHKEVEPEQEDDTIE
jgi:hypothetical protein